MIRALLEKAQEQGDEQLAHV